MNEVLFTQERHLGIITLNRPKALNALNHEMTVAIMAQLQCWAEDASIAAVLIRAVPGRAFCAGGDIRWIYEMGQHDKDSAMDYFRWEYKLNHMIHEYPKPYIALMDGFTMGGGVGVSLHGAYRVAGDGFVFAMPETTIGFFPDIGASYLLHGCPGFVSTYLALTGDRLYHQQALAVGLVDYHLSSASLDVLVDELQSMDLQVAVDEQIKACLSKYALPKKSNAWDEDILQHINQCFKFDAVEDIIQALSMQNNAWSKRVLHDLAYKAPKSLKVTLMQMQKTKNMSLAECLAVDGVLVNHFLHDHDFYEGVRALLIDIDRNPKWRPKTLVEVTDEMVLDYFI